MLESFRTHTGEVVTGDRLRAAFLAVVEAQRDLARRIRESDDYASHVTESQKDAILAHSLQRCDALQRGDARPSLCFLQRLDYHLTGESVPMLSR